MRSLGRCGLVRRALVAGHEMYTPPEGVDQRERRPSDVVLAHVDAEPGVPAASRHILGVLGVHHDAGASVAERRARFDQRASDEKPERLLLDRWHEFPHLPAA
jgi:hypothetical protein